MELFWNRIKAFFKSLFVRSEWTFVSVMYVIGLIILGILLLPFIIIGAIFGFIIWLIMYPSIKRTKKQIMKEIDPNGEMKKNAKKTRKNKMKEATVLNEEIDELDKEKSQLN